MQFHTGRKKARSLSRTFFYYFFWFVIEFTILLAALVFSSSVICTFCLVDLESIADATCGWVRMELRCTYAGPFRFSSSFGGTDPRAGLQLVLGKSG